MKRSLAVWVLAVDLVAATTYARKDGIFNCARPDQPCEFTGRPGCNCHSTYPLAPNSTTALFITGLPTENGYVPGREYDITVWVLGIAPVRPPLLSRGSTVPVSLAGFNLEVTAGELRKVSDSDDTVRLLGTSQATHTANEGVPATLEDGNMRFHWDLRWRAPVSADAGPVTFYLAGNVTNGSDTEDGDVWSVHPGLVVNPAPAP